MNDEFPEDYPINAYRLQMGADFTFKDCIDTLPYLKRLGIDTIYTSPYFENVPGSNNPYMITSTEHFNPDVGTEEEFFALLDAIEAHGMKHILDLVPNHMAASPHNRWFRDLLRNGADSKYASYFDVYWPGKILLPILADSLDVAIEKGDIEIVGKELRVYDQMLPLSHQTEGDSLKEKVLSQNYLLAHWHDSFKKNNYRRFFDIHELIGLRVENHETFQRFHKRIFEFAALGQVHGIRIDHPDGLYDPAAYLNELKLHMPGVYIIVEKILQEGESLPEDWNVEGTVGYSFLNQLTQIYVDGKSEVKFEKIYNKFIGEEFDPDEFVYQAKKQIMTKYISGEITILAKQLYAYIIEFSEGFLGSYRGVKKALIELLAQIVVYRTYIKLSDHKLSLHDSATIEYAFDEMERRCPKLCKASYKMLKWIFSLELPNPFRRIILRLQQLLPCILAKATEDTLFYNYNRFIALNEVGGDPTRMGFPLAEFHLDNQRRLEDHPHGMITITTHDTKRSHDCRMRLVTLSEIPDEWEAFIDQWHRLVKCPIDPNTEYYIYQTLICLWPLDRSGIKERLQEHLVKAVREAKVRTNWVKPNLEYEKKVIDFALSLIDHAEFLETFTPFAKKLAKCGIANSLSSLAIKICSPGAFDLYQGTELYNDSLVDPDNRRPVDYKLRETLLNSGEEKITLLQKGFALRLMHPELFFYGAYEPINFSGPQAQNYIGFKRTYNERTLFVVGARFFMQMPKAPNARMEMTFEGKFTHLITGKSSLITDAILRDVTIENPFAIYFQ
ncbi:MAG: malto-oligosyltrehalose synthase [Simkaniaceae bacterium]|nr:malto-oligosyltrehalose synthase [Simkaniaceae bacterium]